MTARYLAADASGPIIPSEGLLSPCLIPSSQTFFALCTAPTAR